MTPDHVQYTLCYRKGEDTWLEIPLTGELVIGSQPPAHLQLREEGLAAQHVRLTVEAQGVRLTRLAETGAAVMLQGQPLPPQTPTPLTPPHSFTIGAYSFTLLEFKPAETPRPVRIEKAPQPAWLRWALERAPLLGGLLFLAALVILLAVWLLLPRVQQAAPVPASPFAPPPATATPTPSATATPAPFALTATAPPQSAAQLTLSPPGVGEIQIDPIQILANGQTITNAWQTLLTIASGQPIDLNTVISGSNIGFAYGYVGIKGSRPDGSPAYQAIQLQYLGAKENLLVEGVLVPVWGEGEIPLTFNWKPEIALVGSGEQWERALVYPVKYASVADPEAAQYAVNGRYTYASGNQVAARIIFDGNGRMTHLFGYKEASGFRGVPFEIIPDEGDIFTVLLQEIELEGGGQTPPLPEGLPGWIGQLTALPFGQFFDQSGTPGYGKGKFILYEGGILRYQEGEPFRWQRQPAPRGDYIAGFAVEDLDGNYAFAYVPLRVR